MFRLAVASLAMLTGGLITSYAQARAPQALSDAAKSAIIKAILENRLATDGAPEFEKYLVLEMDNLKPSLIPKVGDYQFKLARQKDLNRRARKTAGGLDWIRFGDFEFDGRTVQIAYVQLHVGPGRPPLVRAKDYRYIFRLADGQWRGEALMVIR
jgi:hypothetical protein